MAKPSPAPAPMAMPSPPVPAYSPAPALLSVSAIFAARREAIRLSLLHREPDEGPTLDPDRIYSRRRTA